MDLVRDLAEVGRDDRGLVGGKAANLGELVRAGLPVPPGFVVTTEGYRAFVEANVRPGMSDADLFEALRQAQGAYAGEVPEPVRTQVAAAYSAFGSPPVAVRSSATAEDLAEASFAGQQDTFLNVRGLDAVLAAIRSCWASLWTDRAVDYRSRRLDADDEASAGLALAVVVQEMVEAGSSGVMFTANPSTGRRDETVISAAWGLGESVVGGTVSTDDLVVEHGTGVVTSRTVADKTVRTIYTSTGTTERAVPDGLRRIPVLWDNAAAELAALGERAADHFGAPQDLEWAREGDTFWIVQSRPITALPPPEAPPPTSWDVPHRHDLYARASIVEQLPDPLTPLFAELVDPSVTRSLVGLIDELVHPGVIRPGDVGLPTVNGYAYYRYSQRGMLRLTTRTALALPVLSLGGRRSGVRRWREREHPAYAAAVAAWRDRDLAGLDPDGLLDGVVALLDAGTRYYTSVQTIIPLAATAETAFTAFYDRLVRRRGDPAAATYLLGFDSAPIRADQALFDLATWTREQADLGRFIQDQQTAEVVARFEADEAPEGVDPTTWSAWVSRFRTHLDRFGHAVYNLDFANPVAADEPAPLLETLRFYLRGQGIDPYARQRASATRREEATAATAARLDPVRRAVFGRLLRRAQRTAPIREDALADMGLAWPTLRRLLRELGRRLADAGAVEDRDDVFWLRRGEIEDALRPGATAQSYAQEIEQRRQVWRGRRRATPPQLLPAGGWVELMRRWMPAASETQSGDVITGLAGSAGQVTAPARVLGGPADFGTLQPGEVLVASITTPAWTPLFALAAGVVTDVGGPLSHSSIVAREYGIPAVLGTGVATRRIATGQQITVDGDAGTVDLAAAPINRDAAV